MIPSSSPRDTGTGGGGSGGTGAGTGGGGGGGVGMRQLSAAEERKIDEAMRLASSFARQLTCNAHLHEPLTPRSTGSASSKESLDSPSSATATPGHVFRFAGLRRKVVGNDEKRTFVDGLSLTCNATDIVTPDAQVNSHLAQVDT